MRRHWRDGVIVAIEAHVGGLGGADRLTLVGGKGVIGQGKEFRLLLDEGLAHRDGTVLGARSLSGLTQTPGRGLVIEVVQIAPLSGGEEAIADRQRIARSTRPFSLPRATATGRGSKR